MYHLIAVVVAMILAFTITVAFNLSIVPAVLVGLSLGVIAALVGIALDDDL